jgi:hypothetical protein
VKATPIHWLFDIEIDPTNSDHAVFTTGYGGWETFDLTAADGGKPTHWSALAVGIEETVALQLDSPGLNGSAGGAHLITAIGDYGGFVHWDLDKPAAEGSSAPPRMGNTTGVVSAALKPEVVVRVGDSAQHKAGEGIGYSLDGGKTWKPATSAPTATSRAGSIAVGADGSVWVWSPEREAASVSRDQGATWTAVQGLPMGVRVVADTVDPKVFYGLSLKDQTLYRSVDGAATFTGGHLTMSDVARSRVAGAGAAVPGGATIAVGRIGFMPRRDGRGIFGWRRLTGCITNFRGRHKEAQGRTLLAWREWRRFTRLGLGRLRLGRRIRRSTWWGPCEGSAGYSDRLTRRGRG